MLMLPSQDITECALYLVRMRKSIWAYLLLPFKTTGFALQKQGESVVGTKLTGLWPVFSCR